MNAITTPATPATPAPALKPSRDETATKLRPVVQQWVGQTFFGTMLKEARQGSLIDQDNPLSGGRGGQAFGSMLDQRYAEISASKQGGALVDAIVNQIAGKPAAKSPPAPIDSWTSVSTTA